MAHSSSKMRQLVKKSVGISTQKSGESKVEELCETRRPDCEITLVTLITVLLFIHQYKHIKIGKVWGCSFLTLDLSCMKKAISATRWARPFYCAVLPEASFRCCMLFIILLSFALALFNSFSNSDVRLRSLWQTNTGTNPFDGFP